MEDDNEILDWSNEDDEHNETLRKPPFDNNQRDIGELDAEDSISLGDEDEDNQEYLSYRSEGTNGHSSNARAITELEAPTPTSQETLVATSAKQESQPFSGETTYKKPSTPHKSSSAEDFPRRKQDSRDRTSPQQSQPNTGRLTHALPPKPVTTKVPPYLPPSHPSIVEATSMIISPRAGAREAKKSNGVSSGISIPPTADELPHNWEYRESRNGSGKYFYNKETHESTWEKPVSSIPSTSSHAESRSHRRRSPSVGRRHRTPPDSNPHQSQTTRPSRNSAHMQPDRGMDDATKTAPPDPNGLSYEDRHYRPGGEPPSAPVENRAMGRLSEVVNSRVSSQSRYDRMPPSSPPPSRRRARSPSRESRASYLHEKDQPSRGNSHSDRGQNTYTNDPQRDFETLQPDPGYAAHRWVRPHPLDFPRSDRDPSRRGRRQDDDEPMIDEYPDRNLRRRESSHGPSRDRDPRPSELREDTNQNSVFLSASRRSLTPPPTRDRDRYYAPVVRDYREPLEDPRSTAPQSSRFLRHDPAPPAIGPTINIIPAEVPLNRTRDRDQVSSSTFTHPSRRIGGREYDRNRREQQNLERDELPRRPIEYPPPTNQVLEQSKRHHDRELSRPHPSNIDHSSQDHVGQSSHRKRAPLPPQATTFLTSSTAPVYARDAPPHPPAAPAAPRNFRQPDSSGPDGNVPLAPRSMIYVSEEPLPRSGPTGVEYDRDRNRNSSKQVDRVPNNYPTSLPPINTAMDVDEGSLRSRDGLPSPTSRRNGPKYYQEGDVEPSSGSRWPPNHSTTDGPSGPTGSPISSGPENIRPTERTSSTLGVPPPHLPGDSYSDTRDSDRSRQEEPSGRREERTNRYPRARSKSGGRPAEYARPPAQPSLSTNNNPIGERKPPTPNVIPLSTHTAASSTRPPLSTLIDPSKIRELLPPGKESYERPADLEIADAPQIKIANDASNHNNSRLSESSERQPALRPTAIAPGKPRQRKSRFDKGVAQSEPRNSAREPSPISDKGTRVSQSDARDRRAATPPRLSRESSVVISKEGLSSRLSNTGHQSEVRSDSSSIVPVQSDTHTRPPVTERSDQPLLNRFSKDLVLHEQSLSEKQPQHNHVPPPPAAHPSNVSASSRAGNRSANRWPSDSRENPQNRTVEQPQEYIRPGLASDPPTSLSHRLSNDKSRPRSHPSGGPMSGRDEKSRGDVTLSFHNAHAELVRDPEEGMTMQDRLERPQAQRRGASLLDRLSTGNPRPHDSGAQQSLRERIIIPSKRDHEDMMEEGMRDVPFDGEEATESKRARRKNGRSRTRGGRRGGPP